MALANAWRDLTGEAPTLTRNNDAVSGRQATAFQRLVESVQPEPPIGERLIREVVGEMTKATPPRNLGTNHQKIS
jgi:hypothetical protein